MKRCRNVPGARKLAKRNKNKLWRATSAAGMHKPRRSPIPDRARQAMDPCPLRRSGHICDHAGVSRPCCTPHVSGRLAAQLRRCEALLGHAFQNRLRNAFTPPPQSSLHVPRRARLTRRYKGPGWGGDGGGGGTQQPHLSLRARHSGARSLGARCEILCCDGCMSKRVLGAGSWSKTYDMPRKSGLLRLLAEQSRCSASVEIGIKSPTAIRSRSRSGTPNRLRAERPVLLFHVMSSMRFANAMPQSVCLRHAPTRRQLPLMSYKAFDNTAPPYSMTRKMSLFVSVASISLSCYAEGHGL